MVMKKWPLRKKIADNPQTIYIEVTNDLK